MENINTNDENNLTLLTTVRFDMPSTSQASRENVSCTERRLQIYVNFAHLLFRSRILRMTTKWHEIDIKIGDIDEIDERHG